MKSEEWKRARGIFADTWDGEKPEAAIRRLRDGRTKADDEAREILRKIVEDEHAGLYYDGVEEYDGKAFFYCHYCQVLSQCDMEDFPHTAICPIYRGRELVGEVRDNEAERALAETRANAMVDV